jgi:xanthine dehydrogenase accessory factor
VVEIDAILAALAGAPSQPAALATLVTVEGSSYRRPGARLLLLRDGSCVGSISGGCLEEDIRLRAERVLATGTPEVVTYDTSAENDLVWGVGLGCRGVVQVLIERIPAERPSWLRALADNRAVNRVTSLAVVYAPSRKDAAGRAASGQFRPSGTQLAETFSHESAHDGIFFEMIAASPQLVVFGAGNDARPLVRMAKEVGWRVLVVDARAAYATPERFPEADDVLAMSAAECDGKLPLAADTYVVVMTHRYTEDVKLLAMLLARPLAYLGVLGPRKRTDRILAQLAGEGVVPLAETRERLCAPVGLDLGGSTPETVALCIVAELQCALSGREPIHLRDRAAPIHG